MRVHELDCGTLNAPGGTAVYGSSHFICRVLLIEDGRRLIAVDTGIGHEGIKVPEARLGEWWLAQTGPVLDPAETLRSRISALGLDPRNLTDVILTHHHRDHVDGLADFPWVRVHASDGCRAIVADGDAGLVASQWAHGVVWAPSPTRTEDWHGFASYRLAGLPESIRLVGLVGHSPGHSGVLVDSTDGAQPILHVGDAIHHRAQLTGEATPALEAFARASQHNEDDRLATIRRLAELASEGTVRVVNAHDPSFSEH
ncbi:MBL fold metallo-hydrolase [Micromonospora sp. NPDC048898]|uniref:MBL fold metallo-hydrolase n=1 Tax=Micromonospora sp. NPDC048898 TaxID=3364260 RepID=UPI003721D4F3